MIQFDAAPGVPSNYHRLRVLTMEEIERARFAGYVVDAGNPNEPVRRDGLDNCFDPCLVDDMLDWRIRMYIIWFCYIYENLELIPKPSGAIEEILLEFKAPEILDVTGRRLATLYAGAGATGPLPSHRVKDRLEKLRPHYDKAISLLEQFQREHNVEAAGSSPNS